MKPRTIRGSDHAALGRAIDAGYNYLQLLAGYNDPHYRPVRRRKDATHHLLTERSTLASPTVAKVVEIERVLPADRLVHCFALVDPKGNIRDVYTKRPRESVIGWPYIHDQFDRGHMIEPCDSKAARRMGYRVIPVAVRTVDSIG